MNNWPLSELIAMGIVAIISVIPWARGNGPARWPLLLPVVFGLTWVEYEHHLKTLYPSDPMIRVDLALVIVMFAVTLIATAAWQIVLRNRNGIGKSET